MKRLFRTFLATTYAILICQLGFGDGIDANTKLYLPLNCVTNDATTVNGALEVLDSGNTGYVVSQVGTAQLSTVSKKFGTSSILVDGNSDYLTAPSGNQWDIFGSSCTVECFINLNALPTSGNYIVPIGHSSSSGSNRSWTTYIFNDSGTYKLVIYWTNTGNGGGDWEFINGTTLGTVNTGTWYHFAVVRDGDTLRFFWDGVAVGTGSMAGETPKTGVTAPLTIGCTDIASPTWFVNGYIDEVRISNIARNTGTTFPVPTEQYTSDANTLLLLHMDTQDLSGDGGSGNYHVPDLIGTAALSTAQTKYAGDGTSLLLDGNSDYITIPDSADWDLVASTSQDYTIDLWVKHTDHVGEEGYISQYSTSDNRWTLFHYHGSGIRFVARIGASNLVVTNYAGEITDTNWHHIALCKKCSGGVVTWYTYKDGLLIDTKEASSTGNISAPLYIGNYVSGASTFFDGNIAHPRVQASDIFGAGGDTITVPTAPYSEGGVTTYSQIIGGGLFV